MGRKSKKQKNKTTAKRKGKYVSIKAVADYETPINPITTRMFSEVRTKHDALAAIRQTNTSLSNMASKGMIDEVKEKATRRDKKGRPKPGLYLWASREPTRITSILNQQSRDEKNKQLHMGAEVTSRKYGIPMYTESEADERSKNLFHGLDKDNNAYQDSVSYKSSTNVYLANKIPLLFNPRENVRAAAMSKKTMQRALKNVYDSTLLNAVAKMRNRQIETIGRERLNDKRAHYFSS